MKKAITLSLVGMLCASAFAQAIVGTVGNVNGLVTITRGQQLISASAGTPLQAGDIILSTTGSSATVNINSSTGPCSVSMGSSTAIAVTPSQSCAVMQASVTPVTSSTATASSGTGSVAAVAGAVLIPVGAAVYTFYLSRR